MKIIVFILLISTFSLASSAQDQDQSDGGVSPHWEISTTTGALLPSNLAGVTELLPSVRYSIDKGFTYFRVESMYLFANSEGITFRRFYLSVKNYIKIYDMSYFWYFGVDATEYKRNTIDYQDSEFIRSGGWFYGFGPKLEINKKLFLRAEISISLRPGRLLYAGVGLGFSFGGKEQGKD